MKQASRLFRKSKRDAYFIKIKEMKTEKCSFCGRTKKNVDLLITGANAHICNQCVDQAYLIINEESAKAPKFEKLKKILIETIG